MAEYARDITGDSQPDPIWSGFIASVQRRLGQQASQYYPAIQQTPELQQALANCPKRQALSTPSWSTMLYQDQTCQVNLVAVYRGQGLPLHDHTGSTGLSLVLEGRVLIRYAKRMDINPATGLTRIRMANTQECTAQQTSWFDQQHNLHSIEAISARALLLVVHMPPVNREAQSFYFPLEDTPWLSGQRIHAKRIRVRYNMGH